MIMWDLISQGLLYKIVIIMIIEVDCTCFDKTRFIAMKCKMQKRKTALDTCYMHSICIKALAMILEL